MTPNFTATSEILKKTRQYFWGLNFDEVEIPYLNNNLPLEPNIYSFSTIWSHSQETFYLPTSPEFALKQHLSQTKNNCFAISHCFRDLEAEGPQHTKEFLMLEWYLVDQTLDGLILSTQKYLHNFLPHLKYEFLTLPPLEFDNEPDFNQYFLNQIEPNLPKDKAIFITGYPSFLSPLAKVDFDKPNNFLDRSEREGMSPKVARTTKINLANQTSKRFELYINGIEIANGCEENRNPDTILSAFKQEQQYRELHHLPTHPFSKEFIDISAKLPPCSGIGLGLSRLATILKNHI